MLSEIREIDPAGRVVVPSGARKYLDLNPGDAVQVYVDNGMVIVRKLGEICTFCGAIVDDEEENIMYNSKVICKNCLSEIKKIK